jgi:hypothetical protein
MAAIRYLLNPSRETQQQLDNEISSSVAAPDTTICMEHELSNSTHQTRQKIPKDEAVFQKGQTQGEVRYPPHMIEDPKMLACYERYHVYPLVADIASYPRHIPYKSDKRTLQDKTGRDGFNGEFAISYEIRFSLTVTVFQYVFRAPSSNKDSTILWDYNTGLVRTTPLFRCCNYAKVRGCI